MSAITAKESRKMKKYAVLTREPRCFLGSFDFSWEQRKFSELVQIERGGSPRPIDDFITDAPNGLNWVKIGDAPTQGNYITKTAEKIRPEGLSKTREVHPGDLILSNSMSFGKPYIMGIDGCIHDGWLLIRNTYGVFDLTFLCHLLGTPQMLGQYRSLAAGSTVNNLNKELVGNTVVTIPSITEQRVLGDYLEQLDHLITLHQRKYADLCSPSQVVFSLLFATSTFSWEQRKFEEIAVRSSVICSDANLPRVEYEDIVSGTGRLNKDIYAKESSKSGIAFHQGDVLYGKLRPYLQNWLLPAFDGLAVGDFWVLQPQNADSSFLYRLIQSRQFDEVANQSTGTKMPRADWKLVSKTMFSIPSNICEQAAIGTYFTALDYLITLHQRECISFTGKSVGLIQAINKKQITSSWEQRKAIDIADYSKGNGYSKGNLTDAGTPIILYGRLYTKYQFAISEVDTFAVPRNGAVYSQGNEVIVPASGETAEDIARASAVEKSGVLLGGDLNILRPFEFMNPLFLALAISNGEPQKELAKKAQGKSVVHIHNSDIQEVTIAYPSRTEQDQIVSVFRQLDNLITLHQRKPFLMKWRTSDANRNQTNRLVL